MDGSKNVNFTLTISCEMKHFYSLGWHSSYHLQVEVSWTTYHQNDAVLSQGAQENVL